MTEWMTINLIKNRRVILYKLSKSRHAANLQHKHQAQKLAKQSIQSKTVLQKLANDYQNQNQIQSQLKSTSTRKKRKNKKHNDNNNKKQKKSTMRIIITVIVMIITSQRSN